MPASASAIRAGKAYVELGIDDSGFTKGLKAASGKLKAFGSGLSSVGKKFLAIGAGIGGPLLSAAKVFASVGSEMQELSEKTGVSVESLSGLKYAAEQSGVGIDSLAGGFRKMQKFMADAQNGSKENQEELAALGVSMADLKNLSPDQQFEKFADAISNIHDPAQKAAAAMQVFGKGGVDLLPLLEQGSAGIDGFVKHAKDLGLIISGEDAKSAKQFQQSLGDLWAVISQGVFVIGGALAPVLRGIVQSISKVIVSASAWLKEHKTLIVGVLAAAAALAGFGAAVLSIGTLISTVGSVFATLGTIFSIAMAPLGIIVALLGALMSPIGLVIAAVAGLGVAWATLTSSGRAAMSALGAMFGRLWASFQVAFGGIKDALSAGDLGLAARIAFTELRVAMLEGVSAISDMVGGALGDFIGTLGSQLAGGDLAGVWQTMLKAMSAAWASFSKWVVGIAASIAKGIIGAWAKISGAIASVLEAQINANSNTEDIKKHNEQLAQTARTRRAAMEFLPDDEKQKILAGMSPEERKELDKDNGFHQEKADFGAGSAQGDIDAMAAKWNAGIDDWKQTADANAKTANEALAHATAGGRQASHAALDASLAQLNKERADAAAAAATQAKKDALKKTVEGQVGDLDGVQKKFSVSGTFSSARLGGLAGGANSAAERTAKATEKTNAILAEMNKKIALGTALGAVFGT